MSILENLDTIKEKEERARNIVGILDYRIEKLEQKIAEAVFNGNLQQIKYEIERLESLADARQQYISFVRNYHKIELE